MGHKCYYKIIFLKSLMDIKPLSKSILSDMLEKNFQCEFKNKWKIALLIYTVFSISQKICKPTQMLLLESNAPF